MKKILLIFTAALALASCDLLDQDPSDSVTSGSAITSVEDLANAVNGAYYVATYGDMLTMGSELSIYADLIGPDSYQPASSGQNAARMAQFALTPGDTFNAYYYLYGALANVNMALEKGAKLEDRQGAAPYMAELYAMRGLFHLQLASFFAPMPTSGSANKLGIVLSTAVYPVTHIGERASLDATYEQIVEDFTTAIDTGLNKTKNTGHTNYWGALALRARANLYRGKYGDALADCQEIIRDSPYTLYTISEYPGVWSKEGSSEMLMEYLQTDTYNAQRYAPGYYTNPEGYAEYGLSKSFYDWMRSDAKDVRSQMVGDLTGKNPGYFPLKYPGKDGAALPMYTNNIKVIRLSEVYLIAAEAALHEGADAAGYLNTLRRNRIEGYSDVSSVDLEDILDERRKELFAEGQIAFDYWRNGREIVQANGTRIAATDNKTVLPLPKEEIDLAKGKLIQNPGYGN